ncbi:MAG: peptidase signal peptidase [Pseudonocardiales bacterium]|nr:peptidase signal peptidase [Pseudonocardiales bacterium]
MSSLTAAPQLGTGRHRDATDGGARRIAPLSVLRQLGRVAANVALGRAAVVSGGRAVRIGVGHVGFSPVLSPSMTPTFGPGDLILTRAEPAAKIEVGQILVLPEPNAPGQRYVHRVMAVTVEDGQPVVQTKGDANSAPESFKLRVTSDTVPVVVGSVPHAGRLALLLHGGILRALVIGLIGCCLLVGVKRALLDR